MRTTCELPLIIHREREHALGSLLDQRAVRRTAPDLTDGAVEVQQPMVRDEFGGAESDAGRGRARVRRVDAVTGGEGLLRRHPVESLRIMLGGKCHGRTREHDECLRTTGQR